jgi:IS4 transposase
VPVNAVLQRFIEESPVSVMAQLALQRAITPEWMDALFEQHAERQYTHKLLFSTVVELMSLVSVGMKPSLHAAAQADEDLHVSLAALYEKVKRCEPGLVAALVRGSAERLLPVLACLKAHEAPWVEGFRVRVVDGNHLPASHKRLKPLRGFRGAALPGQSLVVYAPEAGLVVDMVAGEDAHASERTLVEPLLASAQEGDLWLADRNFCTSAILLALAGKRAAFVIREHGAHPHPTPTGKLKKVGRAETGVVFEQPVQVQHEQGRPLALRRIELHLDEPTEEGDTVIALLTNVPPERLSALEAARLYRKRWSVEGMFQRLESVLKSEVRTLGHPRAALLAFGCAVVAYNVLSLLQSAVEVAHPEAQQQGIQLSTYYVADEVRTTYRGMMIAVPEETWDAYHKEAPRQLARTLVKMAAHAQPRRFQKHPRGPKKKVKKGYAPGHIARSHVSTARLLASGRLRSSP